ncbi:hypothetical protein PAPYR_10997 [Paratrimastix pyriformis]|uniref:Uncharacterized protein n=1 Tax=Paratrimastix pyriformis TaxID=342808 RepID=A0ABQ8U902_9EUKA|nr:hypothetical protein PAPYR_10997 [Paratrimastix pyriformis]
MQIRHTGSCLLVPERRSERIREKQAALASVNLPPAPPHHQTGESITTVGLAHLPPVRRPIFPPSRVGPTSSACRQ